MDAHSAKMDGSSIGLPPLFTALTSALGVCAPRVAALEHVLKLVDAFLDRSVLYSIDKAAANGSTTLFARVLHRTVCDESLGCVDDGRLEYALSKALEAAVANGHMSVVQRVHSLHPQRLPVRVTRVAAAHGDLQLVQWLLANRCDDLCIPEPIADRPLNVKGMLKCCMRHAYQAAISHKHLHVVKWLFEKGYIDSLKGAGDAAATTGSLEMMQWVHAQNQPRSFSTDAVDRAVQAGHRHIVEFLITVRSEGCSSMAVSSAIVNGHDEILTLLRANGMANDDVPWALIKEAGEVGRLDILQWDHYAMYDPRYLDSAMSAACENGHQHVVRWLARHRGIKCRLAALSWAAGYGHLNILEWVHYEDCGVWGVEVMDRAAQAGHLNIVQWLHNNRSEGCSTFAMDGAAASGHLHVVQWLHKNRSEGCTREAMDRAAERGHLHVVQWLHENRSEGCTTAAMDRAALFGHVHVVEWLHVNRSEGCTTEAMDGAASSGYLEMLIWLHTNRAEGCTTNAMDYGFLPIVKWLHCHRKEGCTQNAMVRAANNGDLGVLEFLHVNRKEGCTAEAAVRAAKNGHLFVVEWLQARYPDVFDASRVFDAATEARHEHIVQYLHIQNGTQSQQQGG